MTAMAVVLIYPGDPQYHIPSTDNHRRPLCDTGLTREKGMLTSKDTRRTHPLRPCILCHPHLSQNISEMSSNHTDSIDRERWTRALRLETEQTTVIDAGSDQTGTVNDR